MGWIRIGNLLLGDCSKFKDDHFIVIIFSCHYVCGQAENIFRSLKYYIPPDMDLGRTRVMGILDPPRAGMNDKVIIGCRNVSA